MPKDALKKYNEKRDFSITGEPKGTSAKPKKTKLAFVVQKHDATRLHYDFRLEWDGVLWSWAVPKGPSFYPKDKRLAVRTEDHPLSYVDFEGIIPENQYGAGPVMVWDTGTWEPMDDDPASAIKGGSLKFRLKGEKLKGEWALARMKTKDSRENWLLIKHKDETAIDKEDKTFLKKTDYSVKSGRGFSEIAKSTAAESKDKKEPAKKPASTPPSTKKKSAASAKSKITFAALEKKYTAPQLATLADDPPEGDGWVHEVKYDGYRIMVYYIDGEVKIRTRNGHDWTDKFPLLRDAFKKMEIGSFILDGEAVVLGKDGISDFKALQNALGDVNKNMQAYFFDLLYRDGKDFTKEPFSVRRQALETLFGNIPQNPLFLSEVLDGEADMIIGKACDLGLEGLISKKKDAKYNQKRSKSWLKSKCIKRQEFILCGFVPATDRKNAIGSLHLGYHKDSRLFYAGKVGTGFDHKTAKELYARLIKLKRKTPPFDEKPDGSHKDTIWVKPELLGEVKYAFWTDSGKVRHASFQGVREDKAPEEIVKETPKVKTKNSSQKKEVKKERKSKKGSIEIEGITISNADREIFPEAHITKGELAEFYSDLAEHIMPSIEKRPLSVVRCPGGIDKECFFQRSKGKGMPEAIHTVMVTHEKKKHEYLYVDNPAGMIGLVQMGGIELHPWGVTIDKTEKPDRIIFDLDPDEGIPFEAIKLAAQDVRNRLEDLELESFLKCTGGKGLHVVVPIDRRHDWDTVKTFAQGFALKMVDEVPDAYTANLLKKKRKGKIFIDYLRNDFANTAVMDYCVRARAGGPVAVPLWWEELEELEAANQFSMNDVRQRKKKGNIFAPPAIRQSLRKEILEKFS
jgi:bifunctional non-homologous end joining protein LigD